MLPLRFGRDAALRRVLCIGAHADDIEIGCGATMLGLLAEHPGLEVHWVVLSANEQRANEARVSAQQFLSFGKATIAVEQFRDGFFPYQGAEIKEYFEQLKQTYAPDLIFTHYGADRHQDHRLVSELTWNTFRDHLVLEYEIPKYDGDLSTPNVYVAVPLSDRDKKLKVLRDAFTSQHGKHWFTDEVFSGLMRLRGMECASASGYAEAFYGRKLVAQP